jgi:uridylate kinase
MAALTYKRVLLKLSGEALGGGKEAGIDASVAEYVAGEIREAVSIGAQVGVVIGGGNIFRGLAGCASGIPRTRGDSIGMLATVINSLVMASYVEKAGLQARVYSAIAMPETALLYRPEDAAADLEQGRVVFLAGGTGNPFFTTDTAAALRSAEIGAGVLLKATKVDGVYDRDPLKDPSAVKFDTVSYSEAISRKLRVMDLTAFSFCMENSIPIIVFKLMDKGSLRRAIEGQAVGSMVKKEA